MEKNTGGAGGAPPPPAAAVPPPPTLAATGAGARPHPPAWLGAGEPPMGAGPGWAPRRRRGRTTALRGTVSPSSGIASLAHRPSGWWRWGASLPVPPSCPLQIRMPAEEAWLGGGSGTGGAGRRRPAAGVWRGGEREGGERGNDGKLRTVDNF